MAGVNSPARSALHMEKGGPKMSMLRTDRLLSGVTPLHRIPWL